MDSETLAQAEELVGYRFRDPARLEQALTHASARAAGSEGNERLEFLGDAILGFIVSEYVYDRFCEMPEGELTRVKSAVVSRATLARRLQDRGLTAFVRIGKGLAMKSRIPTSVLANVYEAIVAALYIDGGLAPAQRFCISTLSPDIESSMNRTALCDYKSMLQQLSQRHLGEIPQYLVVNSRGPAHGKSFQIVAVIGEQRYRAAWGRSKKDAEQQAAGQALEALHREHPGDPVFENWTPPDRSSSGI
jgi:ribonuclease-3